MAGLRGRPGSGILTRGMTPGANIDWANVADTNLAVKKENAAAGTTTAGAAERNSLTAQGLAVPEGDALKELAKLRREQAGQVAPNALSQRKVDSANIGFTNARRDLTAGPQTGLMQGQTNLYNQQAKSIANDLRLDQDLLAALVSRFSGVDLGDASTGTEFYSIPDTATQDDLTFNNEIDLTGRGLGRR